MSKKDEPKFDVAQWMTEHRDFVAWWKEHRHSGYAEHKDGRSRWGIVPWQAYISERYQAEYSGKSDHYSEQEIADMRAEQHKVEKMTGELEERFGPMFWQTMTPAEWIANAKIVVREIAGSLSKGNQAKIDKAYEYEPGQSEEETELLRRRRE